MVWGNNNDLLRFNSGNKKMKKIVIASPLILLFIVCLFLIIYLFQNNNPNKPPSALINKKLPYFKTENLFNSSEFLTNEDLKNKLVLINFFASWCAPCKAEHHLFFEIKKEFPNLFLLGINHKDDINDALKYLLDEGNPYTYVAKDQNGMISIEFGLVGLPETFLINSDGNIIYKYLGPLTEKIIENEIKPLLQ